VAPWHLVWRDRGARARGKRGTCKRIYLGEVVSTVVALCDMCVVYTGYGLKFSGARMQPLTRGPEADETKTMTVAWPHHACVPLSKRRQHRPARSTCADVSSVRSSPLGADTVCKSGNSFADALFTQGLMALMQPIICCVRAQSARGATPHRSGVAQSYSSELATQAHPSQPHSRLMMPVHVGGRLADSG